MPADQVAVVFDDNSLSHALLVLTQTRYSKIPVINHAGEFKGLVSLADVVAASFKTTEMDPEILKSKKVGEIVINDSIVLSSDWRLDSVCHALIDHAFVPIVDDNQKFIGIITRKEVMKAINHLLHALEKKYVVQPKTMDEETIKIKLKEDKSK
jgi:predicted transcriptional regulator